MVGKPLCLFHYNGKCENNKSLYFLPHIRLNDTLIILWPLLFTHVIAHNCIKSQNNYTAFYASFNTFNDFNMYSMYPTQAFVDTSHKTMQRGPSWKLCTPQSTVFIVIHLTLFFSHMGKKNCLTQDLLFLINTFTLPPLAIGASKYTAIPWEWPMAHL